MGPNQNFGISSPTQADIGKQNVEVFFFSAGPTKILGPKRLKIVGGVNQPTTKKDLCKHQGCEGSKPHGVETSRQKHVSAEKKPIADNVPNQSSLKKK